MMIRILDEVSLGTRNIISLLREIKHWEDITQYLQGQSAVSENCIYCWKVWLVKVKW